MTTYMVATAPEVDRYTILYGISAGLVIGGVLIALDLFFKRYNLRNLNAVILGLFLGYLMGVAAVLFFNAVISFVAIDSFSVKLQVIRIFLYLFAAYFGVVFTLRSSQEIYISIPFVKLDPVNSKKKDLLLDMSVLCDTRIVDLCSSGILDHSLIVPSFIVKELYMQVESGDEMVKNRARKGLDALKKLEHLSELALRKNETDFVDVKDIHAKLARLARLVDANILTADINRVQVAAMDGVKIVNIHMLSNFLKPVTQTGELIKVKVQRFGKESRQGVGYLEDGTMVVINGGGDHIAETIIVRVLSVKHTSSGRMVFCNTLEEDSSPRDENLSIQEVDSVSYAHL
ncbi:MAG: hypothetical protein P4L16_02190 [Chlamydiales bacterium]|nr:hypothetical protein [Chlamydiales bacterium]